MEGSKLYIHMPKAKPIPSPLTNRTVGSYLHLKSMWHISLTHICPFWLYLVASYVYGSVATKIFPCVLIVDVNN
jgi:hypothetical protein